MTAATPEQAADAFMAWAEANGYGNEFARDVGYREMRQAFEAGKLAAGKDARPAPEPIARRLGIAVAALREIRDARDGDAGDLAARAVLALEDIADVDIVVDAFEAGVEAASVLERDPR